MQLRVRAEEVSVTKQVVVRDRVVLRRRQVGDVARVEETIHREQLQLSTEGQVRVTDVAADDVRAGTPRPPEAADHLHGE
jgi:stress response protein YsnF